MLGGRGQISAQTGSSATSAGCAGTTAFLFIKANPDGGDPTGLPVDLQKRVRMQLPHLERGTRG